MIISYIFAAVSYILTAVGQVFLKKGAKCNVVGSFFSAYTNFYTIAGYGIFFVATIISVFALLEIELKVFYAYNALSIILVLVFSSWILKEKIDRRCILASILIAAGVFIFNI